MSEGLTADPKTFIAMELGDGRMRAGFPPFPMILTVEPTNTCNFNCLMCPRQLSTYPVGFMNIKLWEKIIDECALARDRGLILMSPAVKCFFLGEPLLNSDLRAMLKHAWGQKIMTVVSTNGSLLNEKNSRWLLQYSAGLNISFESADAESYEKLRVGGKFAEVVENIKVLARMRKKMNVKPRLNIVAIMPDTDEESTRFMTKFLPLWEGLDVTVSPINHQAHAGLSWMGENGNVKPEKPVDSERNYPCMDGLQSLVIRWDGKTTFCCSDINTEVVLGDLNSDSIMEIWQGSKLTQIRRGILSRNYRSLPVCNRCPVRYTNRQFQFPRKYAKMMGQE